MDKIYICYTFYLILKVENKTDRKCYNLNFNVSLLKPQDMSIKLVLARAKRSIRSRIYKN